MIRDLTDADWPQVWPFWREIVEAGEAQHPGHRHDGRRLGEYVAQWHRDQGFRAIQFNAVVDSREHGLAGLHMRHLVL